MNEEQLIEFINWLPTAVPEFQNATPEQIVQTLNQLYESEEGQATLSQLFTAFQESKNEPQSQMFKKGGKLDQLTQKAKKGKKMCCKKKEIVQGGMVNKVAEKMQDGDKMPPKSVNSLLFPGMNYDYSNLTKPFDENGNIVDTTQSNNPNIFQRFKNWWQRNTQPTTITEPARSPEQIDSLLNMPRPSFFGSPRRKQITSILTAQEGGEFENPIERNATLSTLDILDSARPFIQQNVTPNETREFYAYSRDRLPDNVGGTGNFAGAIRTITPKDTTISYQLPGLAIYTAASSKDRGSRWKEMNSKMDAIKNKANNQKNK